MSASAASTPRPDTPVNRLASLDTYRGFVMFLMAAEMLHWGRVAAQFPESSLWKFIDFHTSHVAWYGCSLHDMIQPSFSFMVGVALPFSIASRVAKGQSALSMTWHAVWRSLILIYLGIFLRSVGRSQPNFTFEDTLTQIGLGYTLLFLVGLRKPVVAWIALALTLVGYWAAWAMYPLPPAGFDFASVGVPADWPHHAKGLAAHWNKNYNLGTAFDRWFLNLFPRAKPFEYNGGGYLTLSFIPTLGTMLLGLICGRLLRGPSSTVHKIQWMIIAGVIGLASGQLLQTLGICPVVKRIWTPAWTLFSGGWCFLLMAAFYWLVDIQGFQKASFPLRVIGMNSIAIYCLVHLIDGFIISSLKTHLGPGFFLMFGKTFEPMFTGACGLFVFWLILLWMYRRKLFLRV